MEGFATNHHFLLPEDAPDFRFLAGVYAVRVFAKRPSAAAAEELMAISLHVSETHAQELWADDTGIYSDWGPDQQAYHPHIDRRLPKPIPDLIRQHSPLSEPSA